ncbi:MAG TPA: YihY/virulence factor BrkB family protein [Gemmatimonadaceae bacterium]|jgi:membrane protein|nr:YihY/virulence factor BrkB family protein [Gemmatimonadaceae bacterium]
MPNRPLPLRILWTLRDYAKRVWDNAGEDNIFFISGGVAFSILLAAVPFVLLLLSAAAYLLNQDTAAASRELWLFLDRLLPQRAGASEPVRQLVDDIIRNRGSVGLIGSIGFIWFSTRLFGSLRSALGEVFDIEQGRSIIGGKLFDIQLSLMSTILFIVYTVLITYTTVATTRGILLLQQLGVRQELMGGLESNIASFIAALFILLMFFLLYKFLPNRRIRWQSAFLAALVTTVLWTLAKNLFTGYVARFRPGGLYTGTLYALVILVVWVYYSAVIFIIGGEVGQVYELRRVRKRQREVFED